MKKIMLIGASLFIMSSFLPAKVSDNRVGSCIWTYCNGTECHEDYRNPEDAADAIERIDDNCEVDDSNA